ncbi:MAG: translation initiation factor [Flavobacteriales bacterium]|nr:translation initiation factor [Flavobacteriales bacterium]|tara:strand:- start:155774 stop:156088 length:315 start_codon:yes stop_codon:yes gene_type:complete
MNLIYSTNQNINKNIQKDNTEKLQNNQQNLLVYTDRHKGNKISVRIEGFVGSDKDLKNLTKTIKMKCGVGGTSKNHIIIIQGNIREKVVIILEKMGFKYKKVGG